MFGYKIIKVNIEKCNIYRIIILKNEIGKQKFLQTLKENKITKKSFVRRPSHNHMI